VEEGLTQTIRYRDQLGEEATCYLVVFDRTPAGRAKSWKERLSWEIVLTAGGPVTVVGA
jgi:hypothetical protein